MGKETGIAYADSTRNAWSGCTKISPGCDACYAEAFNRWTRGKNAETGEAKNWGAGAPRVEHLKGFARDLREWNKLAAAEIAAGARERWVVFVNTFSDFFDNEVPDEWRAAAWPVIKECSALTILLVTKRIGNVPRLMEECTEPGHEWKLPPNVWLGITVVNQMEADRDIPKLLAIPARVRFLSCEPLLGPIDLHNALYVGEEGGHEYVGSKRQMLQWVISGGESGSKARPSHPDWHRSLRDQCAAAGVPFLFKQWGAWLSIDQQIESFTDRLYRSNRIAKLHQDQSALDESYGRRCTVPASVIHRDGSEHGVTAPGAFAQGSGAMTTFNVGKKAAGRELDGRTHDDFPT